MQGCLTGQGQHIAAANTRLSWAAVPMRLTRPWAAEMVSTLGCPAITTTGRPSESQIELPSRSGVSRGRSLRPHPCMAPPWAGSTRWACCLGRDGSEKVSSGSCSDLRSYPAGFRPCQPAGLAGLVTTIVAPKSIESMATKVHMKPTFMAISTVSQSYQPERHQLGRCRGPTIRM